MTTRRTNVLGLMLVLLWSSCSRSDVSRGEWVDAGPGGSEERCNLRDDDLDGKVDEAFRDEQGRYVDDAHCGACGAACDDATCQVRDDVPRCTASQCPEGQALTREGRCADVAERLCLSCAQDSDCGAIEGARCTRIAGESRCTVSCEVGCPDGYTCNDRGVCAPLGGSCSCSPGQTFDLACAGTGERDAGAAVCVGRARCEDGVLSPCITGSEICDELDNDCDGEVDENFRNELGAYGVDEANCGQCGASCEEDTNLELELSCGGDPFAPRCVLACPDARNGTMVGDMLDGDLDPGTGCECRVSSRSDEPGPLGQSGEGLDVNCDGADGDVLLSFYVAADGNDSWPGSPTRPLRTLNVAVQKAAESLATANPRPHVFVASGSYTETLSLADGVQVHGGYRRDFRALDPQAFLVELRAPAPAVSPGGPALIGVNVGQRETRVEWLSLRGLDASDPSEAALGAYLERPGSQLVLRGLVIHTGLSASGTSGRDGTAGTGPTSGAGAGANPRAAVENASHACRVDERNRVLGGAGGRASCESVSANGGNGGTATCPVMSAFQGAGMQGAGTSGGTGGSGGQDASGPISGSGCPSDICCGLADFSVPTAFQGPQPGANGRDGSSGQAGAGCNDARGTFVNGSWQGTRGTAGRSGSPGSGGGGGGAGGGAEMTYYDDVCEFADGLGGGGGGGGAGGCGGTGGTAGSSGAPAVALLVVSPGSFRAEDVTFAPGDGAAGGAGGAGGDGGEGGPGARGGFLPPEQRTTPTLAGTFPGARGGSGGDGGPGGGGGGGCGGASVGVWLVGNAPNGLVGQLRAGNDFSLGAGGAPGNGGGGANSGGRGSRGEASDVVAQP